MSQNYFHACLLTFFGLLSVGFGSPFQRGRLQRLTKRLNLCGGLAQAALAQVLGKGRAAKLPLSKGLSSAFRVHHEKQQVARHQGMYFTRNFPDTLSVYGNT